jgi:tight adherence protein C
MAYALAVFVGLFMLVAGGGVALFQRESMANRVSEVISPKRSRSVRERLQETGLSLTTVVGQFEKFMPRSQGEQSIIRQRLIRAGFRDERALDYFYGAKFLTPIALCLVALVTGLGRFSPFFIYIMCMAFGFLAPDFWIGRVIKTRQKKIRNGMPDLLDLLVICIELRLVVIEQRGGKSRSEAWKGLAERTDVDSVQSIVAVLVQSEKFGTSVAKNLRIHAEVMRTKRKQSIEEQAAKTTVKMVFPLVIFIFPSIFVVTLGPAVIMMMKSFQQYLSH